MRLNISDYGGRILLTVNKNQVTVRHGHYFHIGDMTLEYNKPNISMRNGSIEISTELDNMLVCCIDTDDYYASVHVWGSNNTKNIEYQYASGGNYRNHGWASVLEGYGALSHRYWSHGKEVTEEINRDFNQPLTDANNLDLILLYGINI